MATKYHDLLTQLGQQFTTQAAAIGAQADAEIAALQPVTGPIKPGDGRTKTDKNGVIFSITAAGQISINKGSGFVVDGTTSGVISGDIGPDYPGIFEQTAKAGIYAYTPDPTGYPWTKVSTAPPSGAPWKHFSKGVNIERAKVMDGSLADTDLSYLAGAGVDHARVFIDQWDSGGPGNWPATLDMTKFEWYWSFADRCIKAGLAFNFCPQGGQATPLTDSAGIAKEAGHTAQFAAYIAKRYAGPLKAGMVMQDLDNEFIPYPPSPGGWPTLRAIHQARLTAGRKSVPAMPFVMINWNIQDWGGPVTDTVVGLLALSCHVYWSMDEWTACLQWAAKYGYHPHMGELGRTDGGDRVAFLKQICPAVNGAGSGFALWDLNKDYPIGSGKPFKLDPAIAAAAGWKA